MLLLLLACQPAPEPGGSDVIAPIDDGGPPDDGDSGDSGAPDDTGAGDTGTDTGTPADPLPDVPRVLLNEAMSANACAFSHEGKTPDYVEIYNASSRTVPLDAIALRDTSGALWVGPAGQTLAPGGLYVVYADRGTGEDHAPFTLAQAGDTLTLIVDGTVTDRLGLGWLPDNTAWARFPDGGGWDLTELATPGEPNGDEPGEFVDPYTGAFDVDRVRALSVVLDSDAVDALRSNPTVYTVGGIDLEGVLIDPVGVRLRGSSTFQDIDRKPSMKVDFNRYQGLPSCAAQKRVNLLNMVYDDGFVKQWSAYRVMRAAGVVAPRNGYVAVTVADVYRGVYLYSEAPDDQLMETFFGYPATTEGWMVWEGETECERGDCDDTLLSRMNSILQGTASEEQYAALGELMDWDEVLREIAGEAIVQQTDGFCAPHNYRWYYDPVADKLGVIPSSVDLTFYGAAANINPYQCAGHRHLAWCLQVQSCADRYDEIVLEYADLIEALPLEDEFATIGTMLDPYFDLESWVYSSPAVNRAYVPTMAAYWASMPDILRAKVSTH